MDTIHASVKVFSRAKGHSAVKAAAYRTGRKLLDQRTGSICNYSNRGGVVLHKIMVPENSPDWAYSSAALWNQVEAKENRKNSSVAREFEFSLPHEVSADNRRKLAEDICRHIMKTYGVATEMAIHQPFRKSDDPRNHHCHILFSTRVLTPAGFTDKTRILDEIKTGSDEVETMRALVAERTNHYLHMEKVAKKVDHRSLKRQQAEAKQNNDWIKVMELDRKPQIHMGKGSGKENRWIENEKRTQAHREKLDALVEFLEASQIGPQAASTTPLVEAVKQHSVTKQPLRKSVRLKMFGRYIRRLIGKHRASVKTASPKKDKPKRPAIQKIKWWWLPAKKMAVEKQNEEIREQRQHEHLMRMMSVGSNAMAKISEPKPQAQSVYEPSDKADMDFDNAMRNIEGTGAKSKTSTANGPSKPRPRLRM